MAVSPDDAEDDGWVTDEEDEEEDEDDEDETDEIPFNDDQVWESLGEWAHSLFRDDMRKTAVLLLEFYRQLCPSSSFTNASNVVSNIIGYSGKSIRGWRNQYANNRGDFNDYGRGKYQRESLQEDDDFCNRARNWARENTNVNGQPNMTIHDFRRFVNNSLLPKMQKERDDGLFI